MPPLRITCPNRACGLSGPVPESMFETLITCRCGARFVLGPDGIRQAEVACPGCGTRAMVSASLLDRAVGLKQTGSEEKRNEL